MSLVELFWIVAHGTKRAPVHAAILAFVAHGTNRAARAQAA
eukprot:CAMPEP_0172868740 /NCGR_PEP_ID=MMETSP1075-20121228/87103_1 /TAXON_ID=2916 /ORGANISM="Ceratium fusus, Strain PA161109" /LENGTH=40 /DNA_ID= /DNA_START= /DNA_END= /DNA_ORIENTATION=